MVSFVQHLCAIFNCTYADLSVYLSRDLFRDIAFRILEASVVSVRLPDEDSMPILVTCTTITRESAQELSNGTADGDFLYVPEFFLQHYGRRVEKTHLVVLLSYILHV